MAFLTLTGHLKVIQQGFMLQKAILRQLIPQDGLLQMVV